MSVVQTHVAVPREDLIELAAVINATVATLGELAGDSEGESPLCEFLYPRLNRIDAMLGIPKSDDGHEDWIAYQSRSSELHPRMLATVTTRAELARTVDADWAAVSAGASHG